MNTQAQQILRSRGTKKAKICELAALGFSTQEIADMVGSGYGYVYVVLNYRSGEGPRNGQTAYAPTIFNRRFGIEIEAFGVNNQTLINALRAEGINIYQEGYNHQTRVHWKVVSDSSINGESSFEIVSPILEGIAGLDEVQKVCNVLKRLKAKINKTCGMHIHIDANDFDIKQWRNIYKNYAIFETAIDSFMPQSRRDDNDKLCDCAAAWLCAMMWQHGRIA